MGAKSPSGPLNGFKIVEFAALGPGPFAAMMLADMGAEVIRIDRPSGGGPTVETDVKYELLNRGRRSVALDLKKPEAVAAALRLVEQADALIEGLRPGVMERLGLGPDDCLARNPKLVYGRMTGWGQHGPLASAAGHDIDYIALTGALHAIGPAEFPVAPLNLVGDFGGGGMLLALGIVAALLEASKSGRGQVVDAAMVDGAAALMALTYGRHAASDWEDARESNIVDGGAPFYGTYRTKDGRFVAVGAIEPSFYSALVSTMGLDEATLPDRFDTANWPDMRESFAAVFATKTREEWCAAFEGVDACFAPVLSLAEAPNDPHMAARETFITRDGVMQPAPAPRFSRTPGAIQCPPATPGEHSDEVLADWGFSADEIAALRKSGAAA